MDSVSPELAQQFYQFLKENLSIQLKTQTMGCPEENDSYDEHRVILLLKNPVTGEQEEISSNETRTVTY